VTGEEIRRRIGELVADIVPLARSEAYRVWQKAPHALEMDELEALALSGLASAAARWMPYCAERGHDPSRFEYFYAFCLRRMRGSMLDYLRSQDWVTRSARTKAKALREAGSDRGLSDAELAAATGMGIDDVRATAAAVSARPVSIDAESYDVAAQDDVEGQAVVGQVLAALSAVVTELPETARVVLVLRYYHSMSVPEAAGYAGVSVDEAARLHQGAILQVHAAMLAVVA
jgi:RNA polymerase sigma factor for flagellar operon FliA